MMPYGSGTEGSDIDKNVAALRRTGLDQPVNCVLCPRSELTMWYGPSNRILCDVEVIAVALCPPGMLCKLDCSWLSPFLFLSLGGWFAVSLGHLVLTVLHRDCWEPGGTRVLTSFPRGCVSVLYQDFAPKLGLNLIYRLLDLVNCFELMYLDI